MEKLNVWNAVLTDDVQNSEWLAEISDSEEEESDDDESESDDEEEESDVEQPVELLSLEKESDDDDDLITRLDRPEDEPTVI